MKRVRDNQQAESAHSPARRGRNAGFTLIELVFTIMLISMILGIGVLSMSSIFAERELTVPSTEVRLAAKRALRTAILEQRNYSIVFNYNSFLLRPGAPPPNAERPDEGLDELRARGGKEGEVTNFVLEDEVQFMVRPYNSEEWLVPKNFVWTFSQGGLCDPIGVRLFKGEDYIEMTFNPISGNVSDESSAISGG